MLRARHLNAPLFVAATLRLDEQLDEDMGIGPAEILDGALQRDRLRLVEHRKRMVRKRRTCRQHCGDGDESIIQHPTHLFLHRSGFRVFLPKKAQRYALSREAVLLKPSCPFRRSVSMSFEIACAVNFPHPARTDSSENFIGPDTSAGESLIWGWIIPLEPLTKSVT